MIDIIEINGRSYPVPSGQHVTRTIAAGQKVVVFVSGIQFACHAILGANEIKVAMHGMEDIPTDYLPLAPQVSFNWPHTAITLWNDTASEVTITCVSISGPSIYKDNRDRAVSVTNNIGTASMVMSPYSDDGGHITKIGASYINQDIYNGAGATDVDTELVSAAANVSGLRLRTATIIVRAIGADANYQSCWLKAQNTRTVLFQYGIGFNQLNREMHIPAGYNLVLATTRYVSSTVRISYDLL